MGGGGRCYRQSYGNIINCYTNHGKFTYTHPFTHRPPSTVLIFLTNGQLQTGSRFGENSHGSCYSF